MRRYAASWLLMSSVLLATACADDSRDAGAPPVDPTYGLGRTPRPERLAAIDIDVDTTGHGLPAGSGTATQGAAVFAAQCASCHGARAEGVAPVPPLVGRTPAVGYDFANADRAPRTIGNYWPYATTVFDYVRRAMPLNTPGTLTANETYAVVAWLLHQNDIIAADAVLDATTLPAIRMPARGIFVPDDRQRGGPTFR
ncbi:c-type cytochrome [Gemmatimonas sp.]